MTPGARLQAILDILEVLEAGQAPGDKTLLQYFRKRRYIGSGDRQYIRQLVYAVLRRRAHVDWFLLGHGLMPQQNIHKYGARLRLIAYLRLYENFSLDQVAVLFNGQRYHPIPLAREEKRLFQERDETCWDVPDWVEAEVPSYLWPYLQESFPQDTLGQAQSLNEEAPVDLRVNILKATREDIYHKLLDQGLSVNCTPYSLWGLRLKKRHRLESIPGILTGDIEVQDEGSQLISLLVGAAPGERVMDFCAGAGGKTLAIAATMQNKGHIIACDIADWRLKRATDRLRRAGISNTRVYTLQSHHDPWLKKHRHKMDKVLVDVPCSGVGTWRRHPEQKWRLTLEDLERLVQLQGEILKSAANLVRPGGFLFYSTCSLLNCENVQQIELFLERMEQLGEAFQVVPMSRVWAENISTPFMGLSSSSFLQLTPKWHGTDGFFMAALQKCVLTSSPDSVSHRNRVMM